GEKVWAVSLKKDFDGQVGHGWGFCESVLIDGDKVICTPGGKKGTMAALDKKTGKVIWRTEGVEDTASSSSIVVANVGDNRHYVQMTQQSVLGISPEGKVLWRFPRKGGTAAIPTPIVKDHFVYFASGYGVGCQLLDLVYSPGDKFEYKELYDKEKKGNMDN